MAEFYRQFAFVSSVLAGFAFTFYGTLLVAEREHRARVGSISCSRGVRGLSARYTRHDIWCCACRQPVERVQCIDFGGGSANRAALDVVPRRRGISSW